MVRGRRRYFAVVAEVEVVKAGVATFAASNPEVAEVEVVVGRRRFTFAASDPEVAEVEVVKSRRRYVRRPGTRRSGRGGSGQGRRRYVRRLEPRSGRWNGQGRRCRRLEPRGRGGGVGPTDVGFATDDAAEISGTAASSSHPVPPELVTSPI